MTQLQHVEEDSLASGDPLQTDVSQLHVEEDSLVSADSLHTDMTQLQHAEEDSLASGESLHTRLFGTRQELDWTARLATHIGRPLWSANDKKKKS